MELSRFQEARDAFGSCVALNDKHPQCLNNLSISQRKASLKDAGMKEFRDTQKAQNDPSALFALGRQYKEKGLVSEETRAYKDCLKLDAKYAACHYGLFQVYANGQQRQGAEVACKNFLKYGSVEEFPSEMETCEKFLGAQSY